MKTKTTTRRTVDLTPFCDSASDPFAMRYELMEPFVRDGWIYATDSAICVRVKSRRKNSSGMLPRNMERIFQYDFAQCTDAMPVSVGPHCTCGRCGEEFSLLAYGKQFCPRYVRKMEKLPGLRIGPLFKLSDGHVLPFVAKGGLQGVVLEVAKRS